MISFREFLEILVEWTPIKINIDKSQKIESLKKQGVFEAQKPPQEYEELKSRLEKLEQKKAIIKEKIIKRITKNSKEYVKSIIISYIKKYGKISALQLKEMVVEEQGLCSKSSLRRNRLDSAPVPHGLLRQDIYLM